MKQYLLPQEGTFYKANLHCHSTLSDGKLSPEALRDAYKAHGYQVLAITDHEVMRDHTDLSDENFLILNGYEAYVKERPNDGRFMKTCHMNFIAKSPAQTKLICADPQYMVYYAKRDEKPEEQPRVGELCHRRYGARCVNCMIKKAVENGYLVAYNHPSWSLETIADVQLYQGMYAMEVYNHSCVHADGFTGDDARVYDQLLYQGRRLFPLANDDNHNKFAFDEPLCDSFGGFNMIKAPALDYSSVIAALEKGDFYASSGPEIYELYVEGGKVHIACSDARSIHLSTYGRPSARGFNRQYYAQPGEALHGADIELFRDDMYFRLEVVDHAGRKAWTRAYFLDEMDISEVIA